MTSAAIGQAGATTFTLNNPTAVLSSVGLLAMTANDPASAVAQAGALAMTLNDPEAAVTQAGVLAWVTYDLPYAVAQAGVVALTVNDPEAAITEAGVLAVTINDPAAAITQAGVLAWVTYVPPPGPAPVKAAPRAPGTPIDVQLVYDPALRCCDVVFNGTDFALDTTPASAMLMTLLAKRRANPDDKLPATVPNWHAPNQFNARGGYPGDALDPTGALNGSRMWLFSRRLADEETFADVQNCLAEDMAWLETVRGLALQITVEWIAAQILGYRVRAGSTTVSLKLALNA